MSYSTSVDWADVVPVPLDDAADAPARISYSPEYAEASAYFRAILRCAELSPRALALTEHMIKLNPSFFAAWQHRRSCVEALSTSLADDMALTGSIIARTAKNYQVWHHRRWLVDRLGSTCVPGELELTARQLDDDAKNYHVWSHRQWIVARFREFDREFPFIEALLEADVRNNSAWNHRWFVVTHQAAAAAGVPSGSASAAYGAGSSVLADAALAAAPTPAPAAPIDARLPVDVVERELVWALKHLGKAHRNESAWNFVRAVLRAGSDATAGSSASSATAASAAPAAAVGSPLTAAAAAAEGYQFTLGVGLPAALRALVDAAVARAHAAAEPGVNHFANEAGADLAVGDAVAVLRTAVASASAAADGDASSAAAAVARARDRLQAARRLLDACAEGDSIRERLWRWRVSLVDAIIAALP